MNREARSITQQSQEMLDLAIKKTEQGITLKDVRSNDEKKELTVARPVFDPKLNFWYVGSPPALEEPLVEFKPEAHLGKMPWESVASGTSEQLVFDPKLNFWYAKKAEEKKDEEAEAKDEVGVEECRGKQAGKQEGGDDDLKEVICVI